MAKKAVEKALVVSVPVTGALVTTDTPSAEATSNLVEMGIHVGALGEYTLYGINDGEGNPQPLVETDLYKLAVAKHPSGQLGLAKINTAPEGKAVLQKEARILKTAQTIAAKLDADAVIDGTTPPGYGAFFPMVAETIEPSPEQIVLLLGYHPNIQHYKQLVPMSLATGAVRTSIQSIAWFLGKGSKVLSYFHDLGFTIGHIDSSTVMLETGLHGVFFFDFSQANEHPTPADKAAEIVAIAKLAWEATGGTAEVHHPFAPGAEKAIADFMINLGAQGGNPAMTASEAHMQAYLIFDEVYPKVPNWDNSGMKRQWHEWDIFPRI